MFVDLCRDPELTNHHFLHAYQEIFFIKKKPDSVVIAFRQFVENVYKTFDEGKSYN